MDEERIDAAMASTPRAEFLPADRRGVAEVDAAQPIGYGQTVSQPSTVRMLLEWLDVEPGHTILDVGSGSGWSTAILSKLTGPEGRVYAVETIPELLEFGKENCRRLGVTNASFYQAGKALGLPDHGPYDRILVSAAADEIKLDLVVQLKPGGRLVMPVRHDVVAVSKDANGVLDTDVHPGFVFVPLV